MHANRGLRPLVALLLALALVACGGETDDTPRAAPDTPEQDEPTAGPGEPTDDADDAGTGTEVGDLEPVEVRVNTLHGPDNWMTLALDAYTEAVTAASGGAITFEYFYSNALLEVQERGRGLADGLIDLSIIVPIWTPADFPVDNWIQRLGFGGDDRPVVSTLSKAAAKLQWSWETPEVIEEWQANDLYPLVPSIQVLPAYQLFCSGDAVTTLADASGKRVRTAGDAWAEAAEALGMVPVSLPGPEIFEAMQRGVVDCTMESEETPPSLGTWDVASHWTELDLAGFMSFSLAVGGPFWEGLTPEHRQILWDNVPVFLGELYRLEFGVYHDFYTEAPDRGVEFHAPEEDLRVALAEHHQEAVEQAAANAPDEVQDPEGSIQRLFDLREEWADLVGEDWGYGDGVPDRWPAWAEQVDDPTGIDLAPWLEGLRERILDPAAPDRP